MKTVNEKEKVRTASVARKAGWENQMYRERKKKEESRNKQKGRVTRKKEERKTSGKVKIQWKEKTRKRRRYGEKGTQRKMKREELRKAGFVRRDGLGQLCLSLTQSETGVAWQRLRVEVHIGVGCTCSEFMRMDHPRLLSTPRRAV